VIHKPSQKKTSIIRYSLLGFTEPSQKCETNLLLKTAWLRTWILDGEINRVTKFPMVIKNMENYLNNYQLIRKDRHPSISSRKIIKKQPSICLHKKINELTI